MLYLKVGFFLSDILYINITFFLYLKSFKIFILMSCLEVVNLIALFLGKKKLFFLFIETDKLFT